MRPGCGLVLAALLAVVTAACGPPSGPVEIPQEELPFSLGRSPATPTPPAAERSLIVFFVRKGRLHPVSRTVSSEIPETMASLQALLAGPSEEERAFGITSAIPAQTRLLQVAVFEHIAEVDLSTEFERPAPSHQIVLRVAQVVWTMVRVLPVTAVRFLIEGTALPVVTDRGEPVERPVTAPDYASVAPRGP